MTVSQTSTRIKNNCRFPVGLRVYSADKKVIEKRYPGTEYTLTMKLDAGEYYIVPFGNPEAASFNGSLCVHGTDKDKFELYEEAHKFALAAEDWANKQ